MEKLQPRTMRPLDLRRPRYRDYWRKAPSSCPSAAAAGSRQSSPFDSVSACLPAWWSEWHEGAGEFEIVLSSNKYYIVTEKILFTLKVLYQSLYKQQKHGMEDSIVILYYLEGSSRSEEGGRQRRHCYYGASPGRLPSSGGWIDRDRPFDPIAAWLVLAKYFCIYYDID